MLSDVICTIIGWAQRARGARLLAIVFLLGSSGCGKLLGGVTLDPLRVPPDAGPAVGHEPLAPGLTTCRAGLVRCQGPMLQVCEPDGSGWRPLQRCASAELCDDDEGDQSRCTEPSCEPGITCSGAELLQCNVDRSGFDLIETCQSAAHCDAMSGACEEVRCVPGEVSCNGATLQRCNDGPSGHDELATCVTAALCDDLVRTTCGTNVQSCDVSAAGCPAPACDPAELRCSGARLEICNAGRNDWDFVDECVTAGVCEQTRQNPAAIACLEPVCDVGDVICSASGARLACNVERTDYAVTISQCSSADQCTPQGCQADVCGVGERSCNGTTLQVCQAGVGGRPTRVAVSECATRQLCDLTLTLPATTPPACAPAACAAGGFSCAGRQMQVCNAGRTEFVNRQLCATDALCEAGSGLGVCPTPCSGAACSGSMLRLCNAALTGLVDVEDCGTAAECDAVQGRCADPCVPGALRCNGTALERCQSPLQGWQRLQTCETAGLCQASVQQQQTTCTSRRCSPGQHRCTGQRLEVCNADLTDFSLSVTCATGTICDAPNQQCDVCAADAVSCSGNTFARCSSNGQTLSTLQCAAGLCSASGGNVGCLECAVGGGFRCDNQGSLFLCSLDQRQEDQLAACRTPQLCRASLGRCLDCDPVGSSRCEGDQVLGCSAQNTESVLQECESAALCAEAGTTASCDDSACSSAQLQCTLQGEVLACNAGQTGFVAQSPRVFCTTPALCSATAPGGCNAPACQPGQRQCDGNVLEICNDARTDFQPEQTCNTGGGFSCAQTGTAAACACTPGEYRCVAGQGLSRCNTGGSAFSDLPADFECDGTARLSCSGTSLVRNVCVDAAHCLAAAGASCATCSSAAECDNDLFCDGAESCQAGICTSASTGPCASPTPACSEGAGCVQCIGDAQCPAGQTCTGNACILDPDGGT
jgi:hypothetical protein